MIKINYRIYKTVEILSCCWNIVINNSIIKFFLKEKYESNLLLKWISVNIHYLLQKLNLILKKLLEI